MRKVLTGLLWRWVAGWDYLVDIGFWVLAMVLVVTFVNSFLMYLLGVTDPMLTNVSLYLIGVVVLPLGFGYLPPRATGGG